MKLYEVTPAEYHRKLTCQRGDIFSPDSWLSKSVLWELHASSLYKWRYHSRPHAVTASMQWGTLIDCLTTTPELADTALAISEFESFRTKAAQEWRDKNLADGKIIVTPDLLAEGRKAARMLTHTCERSAGIFARSKSQVIIAGRMHGCNVKGLVDLAPEGEDYLADLKTTSRFSIDGFAWQTAVYGYHVQAGLYLNLWNAMFPHDQRTRFKLIWQDSASPYEVAVTELHRDEIDRGYEYALYQLMRLADAARSDHWPMAFDSQEPLIMRPTWAAIQEEERREAA